MRCVRCVRGPAGERPRAILRISRVQYAPALCMLLTMIAKLALEAERDTRWLGILMSDRVRRGE